LQLGLISQFIKENGVSLNFANLQVQMIAVDEYLQKFLDDMPAMEYLCFIHKLGESTYVRHEQQGWLRLT
jgi:hypothetical protein